MGGFKWRSMVVTGALYFYFKTETHNLSITGDDDRNEAELKAKHSGRIK